MGDEADVLVVIPRALVPCLGHLCVFTVVRMADDEQDRKLLEHG